MIAEGTVGEGHAVLQSHNVWPRRWSGRNDSRPLHQQALCPAPLPISPQTHHCPAPLPRSPGTACSGMPLMGKNLAAGTQYVTRVSKKEEERGESTTGEVSQPSKTITGRRLSVGLGVSPRFPDSRFKVIRLTGHGALLPPHSPATEEILCYSTIISRVVTSDFLLHESYQRADKPWLSATLATHFQSERIVALETGQRVALALRANDRHLRNHF